MPEAKKKTKLVKGKAQRFVVDCAEPAGDDIFDMDAFTDFLKDRIKVQNKAGNLGEFIVVERNGDTDVVEVTAYIPFSKRYLKYLTKKFLKKQRLRDYIRVVARQQHEYFLKYYKLDGGQQEE